jgi:hypothetical protein
LAQPLLLLPDRYDLWIAEQALIARLRRQAMEHLDGVLSVKLQDQREGARA